MYAVLYNVMVEDTLNRTDSLCGVNYVYFCYYEMVKRILHKEMT
jgi:hypothetical protein